VTEELAAYGYHIEIQDRSDRNTMVRKVLINYALLSSALAQAGPWKGAGLSVDYSWCFEALRNKIEATDWQACAEDVRRFVRARDQKSLNLWSRELFLQQLEKIPRE